VIVSRLVVAVHNGSTHGVLSAMSFFLLRAGFVFGIAVESDRIAPALVGEVSAVPNKLLYTVLCGEFELLGPANLTQRLSPSKVVVTKYKNVPKVSRFRVIAIPSSLPLDRMKHIAQK